MALYIATVMYVSIVATALILNFLFGALGITPENDHEAKMDHNMQGGIGLKRIIALLFMAVLLIGLVIFLVTNR